MLKGLEFLKKASLVANEVVKPAIARTVAAKNRNPEVADIRIYKDGSVFPSAALVNEFDLAYRAKDVTPRGQAFDVFSSAEFLNTKHWPAEETVLFITAVDKDQPKTDLFSGSKFDETGAPTADVLTQGAATYGKELLVSLKEVYEVEPNEEGFIDLVILRDMPFNTEDSIYYVPKVVSRGEKKGQSDLLRRENLTLYPLVPAAMMESDADANPEVAGTAQEALAAKATKKEAAEIEA